MKGGSDKIRGSDTAFVQLPFHENGVNAFNGGDAPICDRLRTIHITRVCVVVGRVVNHRVNHIFIHGHFIFI